MRPLFFLLCLLSCSVSFIVYHFHVFSSFISKYVPVLQGSHGRRNKKINETRDRQTKRKRETHTQTESESSVQGREVIASLRIMCCFIYVEIYTCK